MNRTAKATGLLVAMLAIILLTVGLLGALVQLFIGFGNGSL